MFRGGKRSTQAHLHNIVEGCSRARVNVNSCVSILAKFICKLIQTAIEKLRVGHLVDGGVPIGHTWIRIS